MGKEGKRVGRMLKVNSPGPWSPALLRRLLPPIWAPGIQLASWFVFHLNLGFFLVCNLSLSLGGG